MGLRLVNGLFLQFVNFPSNLETEKNSSLAGSYVKAKRESLIQT